MEKCWLWRYNIFRDCYELGDDILKYYGLRNKIKKEDFIYSYAKHKAKLLSILPGKRKTFWKNNYDTIYGDDHFYLKDDNSLPDNAFFDMYSMVVSDLIRREDIKRLQRGIKLLLLKRRSNRFLSTPIEGLDEICKRIEQMDASLLAWYNVVDCGLFEFKNHPLENVIDYFTVKICNVNSGYLSLVFDIKFKNEKKEALKQIIENSYHETRGYAFQTLTGNSKTTGAFKNYFIDRFSDNSLKADKIYEFISYIEWEFLEELSSLFPFVFHNKKVSPPRIEVYSTNIDWRDDNRDFWQSLGVEEYQGQFVDERHKMFFENTLSERYGGLYASNRLIYIFKDDGIEIGQFESIKDRVYYHIKEYAIDYFKFMFLDMLSRKAGKTLVEYKHKLDKIKLKRNNLESLLKLKYNFSMEIDDFNRYKRDDIWDKSKKRFADVYAYSDAVADFALKHFFISHKSFCDNAISESRKIDEDIDMVLAEFEEKKMILQNLADYKNTAYSLRLNVIMTILTAATLFFVIFPNKAKVIANVISTIWNYFIDKL